jgi:hypothetical protein
MHGERSATGFTQQPRQGRRHSTAASHPNGGSNALRVVISSSGNKLDHVRVIAAQHSQERRQRNRICETVAASSQYDNLESATREIKLKVILLSIVMSTSKPTSSAFFSNIPFWIPDHPSR